jgi:hypothetical protein
VRAAPQREQMDGTLIEFQTLIPGRKTGSNVVSGGRGAICPCSSRAANEGYKELSGISQSGDQVTDFLLDFGRVRQGVGHFLAQQFPVALAQTMHRDLHGHDGHVQARRYLRVGRGREIAEQMRAQRIKQLCTARHGHFLAQTPAHRFQSGQRPTTIELVIGRAMLLRFQGEALLGLDRIERNNLAAASALERLGIAMVMVEVVVKRGEEKGAEAPAIGIGSGHGVAGEHLSEKPLREVASLVRVMAAPAHMGVERVPVGLAKSFKRSAGLGGFAVTRRQHHAPMRGGELSR